jgi:hypothetical protein
LSKKTYKFIVWIVLLYALVQISYLVAEYQIAGGKFGAPLDDVWIHVRFAENLAHGLFYHYNPGEPTPGTTSPLWVVILSIPLLISEQLVLPFALLVCSGFFLWMLIELFRLCLRLGFNEGYAFIITLLTLFAGRLLWSSLSGMEITLFALLSVLIFKNHLKELSTGKVTAIGGVLIGLAANARPETYLLAGLYYLTTIFLLGDTLRTNLGRIVLSLAIFAVLLLPYPVFSYIHTKGFLPNTYEGQVAYADYLPNINFIIESAKFFVKDNAIVTLLWLVSSSYFVFKLLLTKKFERDFFFINVWVIMLPLVSSVVAPNWRHHGRYLIPLIPFINVVAVYMLRIGLESERVKSVGLVKKIVVVSIVILSLRTAVVYAGVLGWNVQNINEQQGRIAHWMQANLPDEKAFGMNDIGIITFTTKKYVVDMVGLVTPDILAFHAMSDKEEGTRQLFRYLKAKGVNYIIIYPHWFEYLTANYSDSFQEVYSARLEKNTICGGAEMVVYKIDWEKVETKWRPTPGG